MRKTAYGNETKIKQDIDEWFEEAFIRYNSLYIHIHSPQFFYFQTMTNDHVVSTRGTDKDDPQDVSQGINLWSEIGISIVFKYNAIDIFTTKSIYT